MFTGLIDDVGELTALRDSSAGKTLRIATNYELASLKLGASIACAGICLTVTAAGEEGARRWFEAEAGFETLAKTSLGKWQVGAPVNLERSLKMGDPFGGHLVTGHIDAVARLVSREDKGSAAQLTFDVPQAFAPLVAAKGSVALDGVSLTVNAVVGNRFDVMLIPHTLKVTSFGARQTGDEVNFEVDLIARYLARLHEMQTPLYSQTGS